MSFESVKAILDNRQFETLIGLEEDAWFEAHANWSWQALVKRVSLPAFVVQPPLGEFSCEAVQHGDLMIAGMKITAYNQHCSAPFFRALVIQTAAKVYSVEGADNVI